MPAHDPLDEDDRATAAVGLVLLLAAGFYGGVIGASLVLVVRYFVTG